MARQIIVFPSPAIDSTTIRVRGVLWLTAPSNNIQPVPGFVSAIPIVANAAAYGVSPAELTALQSGAIVEQPFDTDVLSTIGMNGAAQLALVKTRLQAIYTAAQLALNQAATASKFIGSSFDGTTWLIGP